MRVEIVTIGDELLLGFTIDTNAAYLGRALADIGVEIVRRTTIGDEPAAIAGAVRDALDRTGAVVTTGGLGPTADDMTKPAIAGLFGRGMHVDEAHVAWMRTRWRTRYGREMPETNLNQARVPDGAELLPNGHGSAPGIWLEDERGRWVAMLPGVPREARGMCDDALVPRLRDRIASVHGAPPVVRSRTLRTVGIAESVLADLIGDAAAALEDVSVAYLPGVDGVDLRVTTRGVPGPEADARLDAAVAALRAPLGEAVYGEGTLDLAALVVDQLRARRLTLAVAESCTGGLLGARVTSVPGSSDVFLGGVIAYANSVKTALVGVGDDVLAAEGAVSEPVARRLATGARERTGAAVGVGITGVAGPGGGTPEKPVGMVWVAVDVSGTVDAVRLMLWGNREEIRFRATQSALDMIRLRSVPRA